MNPVISSLCHQNRAKPVAILTQVVQVNRFHMGSFEILHGIILRIKHTGLDIMELWCLRVKHELFS